MLVTIVKVIVKTAASLQKASTLRCAFDVHLTLLLAPFYRQEAELPQYPELAGAGVTVWPQSCLPWEQVSGT